LGGLHVKAIEKCKKHYRTPIWTDYKGEKFCFECRREKMGLKGISSTPKRPPSPDIWEEPSLKTPEGRLAALTDALQAGFGTMVLCFVATGLLNAFGYIEPAIALLAPPSIGVAMFFCRAEAVRRR